MKINKINKKVIVLILIITLSNIQSASFGFGMFKKSFTRKNNDNNFNNPHRFKEVKNDKNIQSDQNIQSSNITTSKSSGYYAVSSAITPSQSITTKTSKSQSTITEREGDIPDYSIYYQGWVKYLHYLDNATKKKEFFKNTKFAAESRLKVTDKEIDEVRYISLLF